MRKFKDITGKKYNRLTAIKRIPGEKRPFIPYWVFKCDCGTEKIINRHTVEKNKIKSCGCFQKEREKGASEREIYRVYKSRGEHSFGGFNLTEEYFSDLIKQNCYYCNSKPNNILRKKRLYNSERLKYNGLDRINNNLGYIKGNIVPCCYTCNKAKGVKTFDEFVNWLENLLNYVQS